MKTEEDFAEESTMMHLQNVALLEELEKVEAVAKEFKIKIWNARENCNRKGC